MSMPGWGPSGYASGLRGTGYKQINMPTMNPSQMQLFEQLMGSLQPGLGQGLSQLGQLAGGDQSRFAEMEAPALRQQQQLLGNLASRFSGMGSGSLKSSGFQNMLGDATTDLAERLASQRMGLQQNALAQLLGLSESLLGRQTFSSMFAPKKKSFWQELLGSGASGIGQGLGHGLGSMFGTM